MDEWVDRMVEGTGAGMISFSWYCMVRLLSGIDGTYCCEDSQTIIETSISIQGIDVLRLETGRCRWEYVFSMCIDPIKMIECLSPNISILSELRLRFHEMWNSIGFS